MKKKLMTPTEINNIIWKACDTFRGAIDPAQYKDYILTMLFVKYVSDTRRHNKKKNQMKYANNENMVERSLKNERFQVPNESTFDHLFEKRQATNLGECINIALAKMEEANDGKLDGVFRDIDFNKEAHLGPTKERNRRLRNLLVDFSELDLQPDHLASSDVIGDAYEFLIAKFASDAGKKAGQFYTPSQVSTLLAKLLDPKPGERIIDPACGSGSLLIKLAKEIGSQKNFSLHGQEINRATWALAKMNMFLHGIDGADIVQGDTLNNPQLLEGDSLRKADIIVANPPFSLDKWGAENAKADRFARFHRGIPPKSRGDYAFILHMIASMYHDTGRVGLIVPHGVLFRSNSEGKIRQQLIEENLLEAVIGLPANLFFGTGIPAAILIFNKAKQHNQDVLFIDASKGFKPGTNQNILRNNDIDTIVATYKAFKKATPLTTTQEGRIIQKKYAYRATLKQIQDNGFNLNIPRYVDTFEEEPPVDLPAIKQDIAQIKKQLQEIEAQIHHHLKELGL